LTAHYKLISWNVNGIRAALKKGFWEKAALTSSDIIAVQESKADDEIMASKLLESSIYQRYWHSAQHKKGYSGVCTFTQKQVLENSRGFGIEEFDKEGRVVRTRFEHFTLLNIYFPNGKQNKERLDYKLRFYNAALKYFEKLRAQGEKLIICGDYNTAHQAIDLHDPKNNEKTSGFLVEERAWLDELMEHRYCDVFRMKNPDLENMYTWWDLRTRARERNKGWRIDYFFVAEEIVGSVQEANIFMDVMGSDHCPLALHLAF